jgi:hypothetical protein
MTGMQRPAYDALSIEAYSKKNFFMRTLFDEHYSSTFNRFGSDSSAVSLCVVAPGSGVFRFVAVELLRATLKF